MSTDIFVRLIRPIALTELKDSIAEAIPEILAIASIPPISFFEPTGSGWVHTSATMIGSDGQELAVKLEGLDEAVSLLVIDIPEHPMLEKTESGLWCTASVRAMRTPLELALAACVAIALARLNHTTVVDVGLRWGTIFESAPSDFAQSISIRGPFKDLYEAADRFYAHMNEKKGIKDDRG